MKILLVGEEGKYGPISKRMALEGDRVYHSTSIKKEGFEGEIPDLVISHLDAIPIPLDALNAIGIPIEDYETDFFVIKRFSKTFNQQTIVGIPLLKLMNGDLGPKAFMGSCYRFVSDSPLSDLFRSPSLLNALNGMDYDGFVSFSCSFQGKGLFSITKLELGLPYFV